MKKFIFFILILWIAKSNAQENNFTNTIIPQPNFFKSNGDSLVISGKIKVQFQNNLFSERELKTAQLLEQVFNKENNQTQAGNLIIFNATEKISTDKAAYKIKITPKGIFVSGQEEGLFYAVQSIFQMMPNDFKGKSIKLPCVEIEDQPRYVYRGLQLDVSRHFFSISVIKDIISQMGAYKLNNFHWHLTDDQGWRIEIKKYPKLTEIGSKRAQTLVGNKFERFPRFFDNTPYGGFYTQDEIKEVVKFAAEHYVNVIPEIEMPGHASAAVASYPHLACFPSPSFKVIESWGVFEDVFCAGKEETFVFLEDVLKEVMALFPSQYIHIGGDECPKTKWKKCENCQNRIKKLKLKDEHELQSYFIKRMEKFLNANNRQIFGWDEILEGGLAPNAAVMSWRGEAGGISAAKQKHSVIMTPEDYVYFDHNQGYSPLEPLSVGRLTTLDEVYHYNPTPTHDLSLEEQQYVKGVQANIWTEYITSAPKLSYMLYPRMFALSEIAWTKQENKNYNHFMFHKIPYHLEKLELQNRLYKVPSPLGISDTAIEASQYTLDVQPTLKNGQIFYSIDGYNPDQTSILYQKPVHIDIPKGEYRTIKVVQISPSGKKSSIVKVNVKNSAPLPAQKIEPNQQGLKYAYFQQFFQHTNELEAAKATRSAIHNGKISIADYKSKEILYFGLKLEGFIYIPESGSYTFSCLADDGAKLLIDNELIVDNDGRHWINEAFGSAKLEKGFHKLNVNYFDANGSAELKCFMQQEGKEKQEINANSLFYE
ncbi:MAG: family 20 glycosylhydrolase [Sphingobacteriaceae bacterium]|nr:family 20 glycosylhydrolase [Sphingobacteriaceae bacterium]